MKGLGKRASLLIALAVASVAFCAAAYSLWFEELSLNATVTTSTLDGKIYCGSGTTDNDGVTLANIDGYPQPNPLKNIGQIVEDGSDGDHHYVIAIENAYPGYAADCEVHLKNTAAVPWHVESVSLVVKKDGVVITPPPPLADHLVCINFSCKWGDISPTIGGPGHSDVYFALVGVFQGCQLHTDDTVTASMILGVNQNAMESTAYTFELKFKVVQWNESSWVNCNIPRV